VFSSVQLISNSDSARMSTKSLRYPEQRGDSIELPQASMNALILTALEGRSHVEAAELLGISRKTVEASRKTAL